MPWFNHYGYQLNFNLNLRTYLDFLERWLSDGVAQLPDARPGHAAQPGQIRVQRQLRVRN